MVTETEPVAQALDDAAKLWPEDSDNRTKLLMHLVEEGHKVVVGQHEHSVAARRAAIREMSGALPGVYEDDYLAELREGWPE
ncbi:MAG TPA: hypothetical protein VG756_24210 [Pseudonocardiaceae bacterium]|jgi:hypothetical protein|nr:hypothetical protein [Pseudonocardiaceae bacterium]